MANDGIRFFGIDMIHHMYHMYHTELDLFIHHVPTVKRDGDDREMRFLFSEFTYHEEDGRLVKIHGYDLDHLLDCHKIYHQQPHNTVSIDHQKLYNYLVGSGLEYIRFVPWVVIDGMDFRNSFTLNEWD